MKYISLGYFCSVAIDLERMGLRSHSYPFDWVISDFEGVIEAIENGFTDFLKYEELSQEKANRAIYKNMRYGISFYHDFDSRIPLASQLEKVQQKYCRRIDRFYEDIKTPTLFIRYISDEETIDGKSKELIWIEENYDRIFALLRSFHPDNDILFIANEGVTSEKLQIHHVQRDKTSAAARHPLFKNAELLDKFSTVDYPDREQNIARYKRQHRTFHRYKAKFTTLFRRYFVKEYTHEIQH